MEQPDAIKGKDRPTVLLVVCIVFFIAVMTSAGYLGEVMAAPFVEYFEVSEQQAPYWTNGMSILILVCTMVLVANFTYMAVCDIEEWNKRTEGKA